MMKIFFLSNYAGIQYYPVGRIRATELIESRYFTWKLLNYSLLDEAGWKYDRNIGDPQVLWNNFLNIVISILSVDLKDFGN